MYSIVRPILFALPPSSAHALAIMALGPLEHVAPLRAIARALLAPTDPRLVVRAMGLEFASPIGLAAGFDKNAERARALASLGFGHIELGTVTAEAQEANPLPNMFRLPKDRALINRLGFPNQGATRVIDRLLARRDVGVPVGISIGKSRVVPIDPIENVIEDYVRSFDAVKRAADFVVVNVSSPNTKDLRSMQSAHIARTLFTRLNERNREGDKPVPLLIKIAPDLSDEDLETLLDVVIEAKLDGVVATNTTIARTGLVTDAHEVEAKGAGGLSGAPLRLRSTEVVTRVRAKLGSRATIIGVGGVDSMQHVMAMLMAGANLVQLYTGFIYQGPLVAWSIARALSKACDRTGAKSIDELRGA
jgi:dihydroorotate dehydrogenase